MTRALLITAVAILVLHGLIHFLGLWAYWPLGSIEGLPYKTRLLGGRWEVGAGGIRLFGVLFALVGVGFWVATWAVVAEAPWGGLALLVVTLCSFALTALDYQVARVGLAVNLLILLVLAFGSRLFPPAG